MGVYPLTENWQIQSSAIAAEGGEVISSESYNTSGWYNTAVPNTVMGVLINAGEYPDIYLADNIAKVDENRFAVPWWYRTEFTLPAKEQGKKIMVNFNGINYKANIWINGYKIANAENITGTFRAYEIDITDYVICDGTKKNIISAEVIRPVYKDDLAIYWVDWCPKPPDNNMGLWRDVYISTSGSVKVRSPFVTSKVDANFRAAHLNAYVNLNNNTADVVSGTLEAIINNPVGTNIITLSQPITIDAGVKDQEVAFKADSYSSLNIADPQLWWPINMGAQPLYTIEFKFKVNNEVTDTIVQRFGIREFDSEYNISPSKSNNPPLKDMVQFYINHKPVLVKAGGMAPTDLFLRHSQDANIAVVEYCKDMGLNAVRDEGKFFDDKLLDLLDENGIMYMGGWCCCDRWQQPDEFTDEELEIASKSLYSQLTALRVHPSMVVWLNGSDNPASIDSTDRGIQVEQTYLDVEHKLHWEDSGAIISSGSAKVAGVSKTVGGMHMDATYDYVPAAQYFEDMNFGGAFGFTSEAGPGPSIPVAETLKKILPKSNQWPYNIGGMNYSLWNYHGARGSFANLKVFNMALDNHYGQQSSLDEYVMKAQVQEYDSVRAQFEALNANKYTKASGWVQWMLNNGWPGLFWNLFDFYLNPNGSYFGAKKANEPLHIMFDYATKEVKVINSTLNEYSDLKAVVQVFNIDSKKVYDKKFNKISVSPDGASAAEGSHPRQIGYQTINFNGTISAAYGITIIDRINEENINVSPVYFIRLKLTDKNNNLLSMNSYAETTKKDLPRYQNHNWNVTLQDMYADYTALQNLKPVDLKLSGVKTAVDSKGEQTLSFTVKNDGKDIAYAVFAEIKKGTSGDLIAPVKFEDNYFMLLPGEKRTLFAKYKLTDSGNTIPKVEVSCYNNICTTKQNQHPATTNIALGKIAESSTTEGPNTANMAIDGSMCSMWQSSTDTAVGADPQWFMVNLGEPARFDRVIIRWDYLYYAKNITIEVSDDNVTWQEVYNGTSSNGFSINDVQFAPVTKQYIRVVMSGKRDAAPIIGLGGSIDSTGMDATAVSNCFCIDEFEVYGPAK